MDGVHAAYPTASYPGDRKVSPPQGAPEIYSEPKSKGSWLQSCPGEALQAERSFLNPLPGESGRAVGLLVHAALTCQVTSGKPGPLYGPQAPHL